MGGRTENYLPSKPLRQITCNDQWATEISSQGRPQSRLHHCWDRQSSTAKRPNLLSVPPFGSSPVRPWGGRVIDAYYQAVPSFLFLWSNTITFHSPCILTQHAHTHFDRSLIIRWRDRETNSRGTRQHWMRPPWAFIGLSEPIKRIAFCGSCWFRFRHGQITK